MEFFEAFAGAVSRSRSLLQKAAAGRPHARGGGEYTALAPPDEAHHEIRILSGSCSSIQKLIQESYVRDGVKVPSSLSQLLPKMQIVCPIIVFRVTVPEHDKNAPDFSRIFLQDRSANVVLSISRLRWCGVAQ